MTNAPTPRMAIASPRACVPRFLLLLIACAMGTGCATVKRSAVNQAGNALSGSGVVFSSDDDPEFIRLAAPFSLKMMETLLQESPDHERLLLAATKGFTQYAYAFIQQDGDALESEDLDSAIHEWNRARAMFLRARDYGLRGLEVARPGFSGAMRADPREAVASVPKEQVSLLYWTACAWGGAISLSKDDPNLIADLPQVEALIDRAFALKPDFDSGAIHQFLIAFTWVRVDREGDPVERSRHHFLRAIELSEGNMASPFVSLAETVSVREQNRTEFEVLLGRALAIDVDHVPEWRLANLVAQRRARWLLSLVEDLILDMSSTAIPEEAQE